MTSLHNDEQELVERANQGDEQAFGLLYSRHRDWVAALALQLTHNRQDALDVLQETFLYFFRKFPGFVLTSSVRGFLYPVVRNTSISLLRRRRRFVKLDEVSKERPANSLMHSGSILQKRVEELEEGQQEVILLRFGLQMRLEEIADALGVPLGTVKSRLCNGLKILRKSLLEKNSRS